MTHVRWFFLLAGLTLAVSMSSLLAQSGSWEGTLVDSKCYLADNSLTGNDHGAMKECGTICLKMGQPAGLVTPDKSFHPIIAVIDRPGAAHRPHDPGDRHPPW